ncbi:hypothetical protein TNCV_3944721 [Trichonephila clavipes]|nr:hypothetical protein TNCV_3944721 [Trichonephila clavipes]
MKTLTDKMPTLRSKMTGDDLKLCTDTFDQHHQLNHILEQLKYEFYSITPKTERPIKVVIKRLPRETKATDIHCDLIDLGFTVGRVTQIIGRISNQPLPVFLISLPRNLTNVKIFSVDKLCYLTVRVEVFLKAKRLPNAFKATNSIIPRTTVITPLDV